MGSFKKNSGITLMSLIITIIIMLILATVSVNMITEDDGVIQEAKDAKEATERADIEEQIAISILQAEAQTDETTIDDVTQQLLNNKIITDASQVNTSTGAITVGDYVIEGMLTDYLLGDDSGDTETDSGNYYGDSSVEPTDQKYFTFTVDETAKTATITGIKDEYAVKGYYEVNPDVSADPLEVNRAINDNGTYITEMVVPYQYVDENNTAYTVTTLGTNVFGNDYYFFGNYGYDDNGDEYAEMFNKIILPNTIMEIENGAFVGTKKLTEINLPNSVTNIGEGVFAASGLVNVNIPKGVTAIGERAFWGCANLETVYIPEVVSSIGTAAFSGCTSLSSINIPDGVTSIESAAFSGCRSLSNINIPSSVTTMGSYVFSGWTASQTINCEAASVPSGWDAKWDYYDDSIARKATLNWGVSM